jgi:hypothetical protein
MSNTVRIEVQDQFGSWKLFTNTSANSASIKLALAQALRSQLAAKSKKARAIDAQTGALIDMAHG